MFDQALPRLIAQLSASDALIARLDRVRIISHNFGYGVGDDMDSMLAKYTQRKDRPSTAPIILIPAPISPFTHPCRKLTVQRQAGRIVPDQA